MADVGFDFGFNPLDILGFIGGYINTKQTNKKNEQLTRETNEANKRMVEMQNEAAARQSALAYERSKPTTQVGNMMQVGMSRAGAINALNGGGSYTPAPVNVSQQEAPQHEKVDFSLLSNVMQISRAMAQEKHNERMLSKQLAAQKEENAANRKNAKEIAEIQADASKYGADSSAGASKYGADSSSKTASERLAFEKEKWNDEVKLLRSQIRNLDSNTSLTDEQKKQLVELKPYLKENAIEEVNKLKEEVNSIKSIRDLDVKRFALERLKVRLESYYGVSINHMRNTLAYWEDKPETLYKGFSWRQGKLKDLNAKEEEFMNYLEDLNDILDSLD